MLGVVTTKEPVNRGFLSGVMFNNINRTGRLWTMDGGGAPGDISPKYQRGPGRHLGDKCTSIMISVVHIRKCDYV